MKLIKEPQVGKTPAKAMKQNSAVSANSPTTVEVTSRTREAAFAGPLLELDQHVGVQELAGQIAHQAGQHDPGHETQHG